MDESSFSLLFNRIWFDPLSYLHPLRLSVAAEFIASHKARSMANDCIIAALQLEVTPPLPKSHSVVWQWLPHWVNLPQVAYLIGCQALRADLAWQGGQFHVPGWAQVFVTMNFPTPVSSQRQTVSQTRIIQTGYAKLLPLIAGLPAALVQRFPLLFSPCVDTVAAQPGVHPSLLNLALHYAQTHPHTPPAES